MAKSKKSGGSRKSDSNRNLGIGIAVVAGAAGLYFLLRPSTASAATSPVRPVSPRGTTPSPSPPRTPATTAKPVMPADLQADAGGTEEGAKAFWTLAALYTLDPRAGAPTKLDVGRLAVGAGLSTSAAAAASRLGIGSGPLMRPVFALVRGRRLTLPYSVPSDVWNVVNIVMKDTFNEGDISLLEPT